MSVWDWIQEFRQEAAARGDRERLRLYELFRDASKFDESDPDRALAVYAEGRRLAERLGEPRWVLFYDHWRVQTLLHHKCDYRTGGEVAVRAALEARKPAYADLPQRNCLQEDLIRYYLHTDPLGNEQLLREALDFMDREVGPGMECRHCLASCRARFERSCGRPEAARVAALRALEIAEDDADEHYIANAYGELCAVAHDLGDAEALRDWAVAGEEVARAVPNKQEDLATFLAWQAYLARRDRDEHRARYLFRAAAARLARIKTLPGEDYHDACRAYHEQGDDLEAALRVCDRELAALDGTGCVAPQCRVRLKRCQLLRRLGRLSDADLETARAAASALRLPGPHLAELERLRS